MKKHLLATVLAALALPAVAADLPPIPPPKAPVASPVPTGLYLDVLATGSVLKPGGGIDTLAPAGQSFGVPVATPGSAISF